MRYLDGRECDSCPEADGLEPMAREPREVNPPSTRCHTAAGAKAVRECVGRGRLVDADRARSAPFA